MITGHPRCHLRERRLGGAGRSHAQATILQQLAADLLRRHVLGVDLQRVLQRLLHRLPHIVPSRMHPNHHPTRGG